VFSSFLFGPQPENTEGSLTYIPFVLAGAWQQCLALSCLDHSLKTQKAAALQLAHRILGREFPIQVD
jgi:hypothetical protein